MRRLTSIVALNQDGAIGAGNALPWRVRSDLKFFREQTLGNVVIMGRRTFESLRSPLPDRKNIVVTHGFAFFPSTNNCKAAGSIDEAIVEARRWGGKSGEAFIVGGASMYEQFSPYVDRYLITEVDKLVPDADTFFSADIIRRNYAWKTHLIQSGLANGTTDEADYKIFEIVANERNVFSENRNQIIEEWRERKASNLLMTEHEKLRAIG